MLAIVKKEKYITVHDADDHLAATVLDLTGLKCPLPVLKARRQIQQAAAGAVLVVMADDPAAPLDFEHFCFSSGHQMLESSENDGVFIMRIAKSAE